MTSDSAKRETIMIFGAGQTGRMAATWIPASLMLTGYIDNNPALQGQDVYGVPVFDMADALQRHPGEILIAVMNREAAKEIKASLRAANYTGGIHLLTDFRRLQDLRLSALRLIARQMTSRNIKGAVAELGVYEGTFAAFINAAFPDRDLYLFDTFSGFDEADLIEERRVSPDGRNAVHPQDFSGTSVDAVRKRLPHPSLAHFCQGRFPESLKDAKKLPEQVCFVSLDTDLYAPTLAGLQWFAPRMVRDGVIFVHDYHSAQYPGVRMAVDEFCDKCRMLPLPLPDPHGTAILHFS